MKEIYVAVFLNIAGLVSARSNPNLTHSERLHRDLFSNHKNALFPKVNASEKLNISVQTSLYQIIDVDEPSQSMTVYVWLSYEWQDDYLGWDPEDYGGLEKIQVPHHLLWNPDIYFNNGLNMDKSAIIWPTEAHLVTDEIDGTDPFNSSRNSYWHAQVYYSYPAILRFSCSFRTLYFPFDRQNCSLLLSSWSYTSEKVDVWPEKPVMNRYSYGENEIWELEGTGQRRSVFDEDGNYVFFSADILVRRKPRYYLVNLVLPFIVIAETSFLGMFSPDGTGDDRAEKISLGMATLLALTVMLTVVADLMPATSSYVPAISWLFLIVMLMVGLGMVATVVIMGVERKGKRGKPLPPAIRSLFFGRLGRLLCMGQDIDIHQTQPIKALNNPGNTITAKGKGRVENLDFASDEKGQNELLGALKSIEVIFVKMECRRKAKEKSDENEEEWRLLGDILDRLMLILFSLTLFIISLVILGVSSLSA